MVVVDGGGEGWDGGAGQCGWLLGGSIGSMGRWDLLFGGRAEGLS